MTRTTPLLIFAAAMVTSCYRAGPMPLPAWAIHVAPPRIDTQVLVKDAMAQLIRELESPQLGPSYTSAEQIAVLAVREIANRHPLDAMLLLSLASYRYHQEALLAVARAKPAAKVHLRNRPGKALKAYWDLVRAEFETYNSLDFDREARLAFGVWQEKRGVFDKLEKGLSDIMSGNPLHANADSDKLFAEIEEARRAEWSDLSRPRLATALLKRLEADSKLEENRGHAEFYLAQIPLKSYQEAALIRASRYFSPTTCRQIVARHAAYREMIMRALVSQQPTTRANAAIIMGLKGTEGDLPSVEQAYAKEVDPQTRLAMAFSLIHYQKVEYLPLLTTAAVDCRVEESCDLSLQLLQWLPQDVKATIDQNLLVGVTENPSRTAFAKLFAVVILGDIGAQHELTPRAVKSLFTATRADDDLTVEWAARGVSRLQQLSRGELSSRLVEPRTDHQALLLRLAVIAQVDDIPFLRRRIATIGRAGRLEQQAVIAALSRIGDQTAEDLLVEVFRKHKQLRIDVAFALADRRMSKDKLRALASIDDGVPSLILSILAQSPHAPELARRLMSSGDVGQRYQSAHVARIAGKTSLRNELWKLVAYSDSRYYPADAHVRHGALSALLEFELKRAVGAPMSWLDSLESSSKRKPSD